MRLVGQVFPRGGLWAIEIPILAVFTQGTTRANAFEMVEDAVSELVGREGFEAKVYPDDGETFELGSNDPAALTAMMLRRIRSRAGLTLAQVAKRLDAKSLNAWARYEQGRAVPTIAKLSELFAAAAPGLDFVIAESRIRD